MYDASKGQPWPAPVLADIALELQSRGVRVKNWDEMVEPTYQPEFVFENDPVGIGTHCRLRRFWHLVHKLLEADGHQRRS